MNITGIDLVIFIFIALITYIGFKRGLILEVFDLIVLFLDTALSLRFYKYLAGFIIHFFPQSAKAAYWVSFIAAFMLIGLVLIVIGLFIDKAVKFAIVLKSLNSLGGALFAFAKSFLLVWLVLLVIFIFPFKKEFKYNVYHSLAPSLVWGKTPMVLDLVEVITPPNISKSLRKTISNIKV